MEAFQQRGLRRTLSALNSVRHSDMKSGEAISKWNARPQFSTQRSNSCNNMQHSSDRFYSNRLGMYRHGKTTNIYNLFTARAWMATHGTLWLIRFTIDFRQSLGLHTEHIITLAIYLTTAYKQEAKPIESNTICKKSYPVRLDFTLSQISIIRPQSSTVRCSSVAFSENQNTNKPFVTFNVFTSELRHKIYFSLV